MNEFSANFAHQANLFNPRKAKPLTIIGGGSVGSWVAFLAAKMGVNDIVVIDPDTVDSHNSPMSLYRPSDTGRYKVDALQEIILHMSGLQIGTVKEMYTSQAIRRGSVVVSVDLMKSRSDVYACLAGSIKHDILIDTRVEAAYGEVLSIVPFAKDEQADYEALLYTDADARLQTCGNHGVVYNSAGVAAFVCANLARFWTTGQKQWRHGYKYDTLTPVF